MKMSRDEQDRYKRYYCDAASFAYTQKVEKRLAYDEGIAIGEEQGIILVAKKMKESGMPIEQIIALTSLSKEQIERI